ncbi:MAG: hypothetical protein RQ899_10175 [Pseudomonadales bacterium]|nr:hypothetical protein [Pseudomonadales bacterium]
MRNGQFGQEGLQENAKAEQGFLNAVQQELDRSCEALDGHTRSRLNHIRHAALERKGRSSRALLMPFSGIVSATVVLTMMVVFSQNHPALPGVDPTLASPLEDIEILISADSLELYEDFEFYQWLAENDAAA